MSLLKPMLAEKADISTLKYPVYASYKIDGIRATIQNGVVLSRSLKPIPNRYVQETFKHLDGLDGELVVGPWLAPNVYNTTMKGVMSHSGEPDVSFIVFDSIENKPFHKRLQTIQQIPTYQRVRALEQTLIHSQGELLAFVERARQDGAEGVMIRSPEGPYKHGRSTAREGYLLKIKATDDIDAKIIGYKEMYHNFNEPKTNELGRTERSTKKGGLEPAGLLGAWVMKSSDYDLPFDCGTGFTMEDRDTLWKTREEHIGKWAKVKITPFGEKDRPRHPVWIGFRSEYDKD